MTGRAFLTQQLRRALRDRWDSTLIAMVCSGCRWVAVRALTLAAYHPDQFSFAGSFSGYLKFPRPVCGRRSGRP